MKYRTQKASDIIRDGLGLELIDKNGEVVAEVFRADNNNELIFSAFKENLPFVEVELLITRARAELGAFEDGTPLPR